MSLRHIPVPMLLGLLSLADCTSSPVQGGAAATAPLASAVTPLEPAGTCVPVTCDFVVASCGELSDGCGGTLRCGACGTGQTCGGDGLPNVCSAQASGPKVQWVTTFPSGVFGLATGRGASIFVLRHNESRHALTLLEPDGAERWTRGDLGQVNFSGVSVSASGELLAWGRRDGAAGSNVNVFRLTASGKVQDTDSLDNLPEHRLQDGAGNVLGYDRTTTSAYVRYKPSKGAGWTIQSTPRWAYPAVESWDPFYYQTVALDPRGGAFVTGSLHGEGTVLGQHMGKPEQTSSFVLKVSAEGKLVRAFELPDTQAALLQLGTSASGALVGQGNYVGSLRWSGGVLRSGDRNESRPFLMSLDEQGHLAWMRALPWPLSAGQMAVSAGGKIAVANGFTLESSRKASASAIHVRVYDAQGNLEWSRTFSSSESSGSLSVGGLDWSGEQLVLAGSFSGAVDFGMGVLQGPTDPAASNRGFVVKFR